MAKYVAPMWAICKLSEKLDFMVGWIQKEGWQINFQNETILIAAEGFDSGFSYECIDGG